MARATLATIIPPTTVPTNHSYWLFELVHDAKQEHVQQLNKLDFDSGGARIASMQAILAPD